MGAAVGAVLLGPFGLLLGGLSGSKRQKERVNELSLKVILADHNAPVHRVIFFKLGGNGLDAKDRKLKEPADRIERFHAVLENAIRESSFNSSPLKSENLLPSVSSTDEIAKLWQLREAGALTADEYASQKRSILGTD